MFLKLLQAESFLRYSIWQDAWFEVERFKYQFQKSFKQAAKSNTNPNGVICFYDFPFESFVHSTWNYFSRLV